MKIAPEAKLNDGRFDVVVINELGASDTLLNAPKLYLGAHLECGRFATRSPDALSRGLRKMTMKF
jgi:diacylglycerol kinase family enzyme